MVALLTQLRTDDILFVDGIPLTSTGKMDKKIVRGELDAEGYVLPDLRAVESGGAR